MRPLRLLPALLLLLLILFQSIGWVLCWQEARRSAGVLSHEAGEKAGESRICVVLHGADFEKVRLRNGEIHWQGHLYDIQQRTLQGDSIVLVLFHDAREERLFSLLRAVIHPLDAARQSVLLLQMWGIWLTLFYLVPDVLQRPDQKAAVAERVLFFYGHAPCPAPAFDIFEPPRQGYAEMA